MGINKEKIAIIGAGPAGIFLSLLLKNGNNNGENNLEIHIFEENHQIGKKLKLTGNGKMNVTNRNFGEEHFFSNEDRILKNFFKNNFTKNPEKIFDQIGIKYFWKGNRAILKNENAKEEVENLEKILEQTQNIIIHKGSKIEEIEKILEKNINKNIDKNIDKKNDEKLENISEKFVIKSGKYEKNDEIFDKVILSTGGMLKIGITDKNLKKKSEIYTIPEKLGHTITKTEASLSPIIIKDSPFSELSGTAFFGEISDEKNPKNRIIGDILFTHKGLSGPAILDYTANEIGENCEINFFPENKNLEEKFLEKFLSKKDKPGESKQKISEFIKKFPEEKNLNKIPNKLIDFILGRTLKQNSFGDKISDTKISDISKKNFLEIRKDLFHLKIKDCEKMTYQFCRTTKGGINIKEININSLESKLHKNLFFAGEIIDINGLCGGYNISFAAICAKIISEEILKK